jgi:eukaryotic-like serine/threonine-protein kinase
VRVKLSKIRGKKILLPTLLGLSLLILPLSGCGGGIPLRGWSGSAVMNGTIFVGGTDATLYAVRGSDRNILWTAPLETPTTSGFLIFTTTSEVAIYGTPATDGNKVYAGTYVRNGNQESGRVFAFPADKPQATWVYPAQGALNGAIIGSPAVADGVVYVSATNGKVYAIDAATGNEKWVFQTGDQIWASPVVSNGTVYIGSFDKRMYALDAAKGVEKWHFDTDGAVVTSPVILNGSIYFGSYNRHFYAVDVETGNQKWDITAERGFWATPVAAAGAIFAPCLDGNVYALDPSNGRELSRAKLSDLVCSNPTAVDNAAIVASQDGNVYSLALNSGPTPSPVIELKNTVQAPLTLSEGNIYIHTSPPSGNVLYVIDATGKQVWNPPLPLAAPQK